MQANLFQLPILGWCQFQSRGSDSQPGGYLFYLNQPLRKIFNRHTVKVSYRTTPNMQQIITSHNKKLLTKPVTKKCTCKVNSCPVQGKCKVEGSIYQATVKHSCPDTGQSIVQTYVGLSATTFYERHQNHKTTF